MKKQFIYFILAFIFSVGTISIGQANVTEDPGEVVVICKTAEGQFLTFSLPNELGDQAGSLAAPMQVTVTTKKGKSIYSATLNGSYIEIPKLKTSAKCTVTIKVGGFVSTQTL